MIPEEAANLVALLIASKHFPFAAKAGEILAAKHPQRAITSPTSVDADGLLAKLARRYQTPMPEAYLSEAITAQQGQRRQQGAFYTPWPLAQYLMRSAAEILAAEFPIAKPTYLDPAAGAGIFYLAGAPQLANAWYLGWDASNLAVQLASAIVAARKDGLSISPTFEHRDALLAEPHDLPERDARQPLVIVGNPPYSNFGKRAISPWLQHELKAYRPIAGEQKTNLRDAFLQFLRLAQSFIEARGQGIIAMVLSATFLDAITHSQVRASLLQTFDELRILRLQSENAQADENPFSIRHPTAACIFLRRPDATKIRGGKIWVAAIRGSRDSKLRWLSEHTCSSTSWEEFSSAEAQSVRGGAGWGIPCIAPAWYASAPSIPEIFNEYISGVQTKDDALFLARTRGELEAKIRARFGKFDPALVQTILVAPFDPWWIYYDTNLLGRARYPVMRNMLSDNLALVFMRQATTASEYDHFLVTRHLVTDRVFHSRWGAPFLAPLYLETGDQRAPNLRQSESHLPPESYLAYAYALMHSKWYRQTAGAALRRDFPRVPEPCRLPPFVADRLVGIGRQLMEQHASANQLDAQHITGERSSGIRIDHRFPQTSEVGGQLQILTSKKEVFATLPVEVWARNIGGVPVLGRFLARRRRSELLMWEVDHFHRVASVMQSTIQLQKEIDSFNLDL
jgi:hypothetical protein